MPFVATWVDLGIIILTEVSHTKRHIICYHLNVKTKITNDPNEVIYKTETDTDLCNNVC